MYLERDWKKGGHKLVIISTFLDLLTYSEPILAKLPITLNQKLVLLLNIPQTEAWLLLNINRPLSSTCCTTDPR